METQTLSKLILIAERARRDPAYRFTCLAHLLDEGFLKTCYLELGKDRASGVDGVSWQEYGKQLDDNLKDLVERMKAKRYKPQPAKRVYIPKDGNSKRPLGLPALEDKIVQRGKLWWKQFTEYVKHYPLPLPAIKHHLFTLSPVK